MTNQRLGVLAAGVAGGLLLARILPKTWWVTVLVVVLLVAAWRIVRSRGQRS